MGYILCEKHGGKIITFVESESAEELKIDSQFKPEDWVWLSMNSTGVLNPGFYVLRAKISLLSEKKRFEYLAKRMGNVRPQCPLCFTEILGLSSNDQKIESIKVSYGLGEEGDFELFCDLITPN